MLNSSNEMFIHLFSIISKNMQLIYWMFDSVHWSSLVIEALLLWPPA